MSDLISRADAIEAVADRIYDDLCYMYCNNCRYDSEIGEDDPRWSCYDCYRKYNSWGISSAVAKGIAENALSALPSAEAAQGEWSQMIADGTDGSHWYEYECSHCGEVVLRPYNFCPNCGARMKGGDVE